MQTNRVLRSDIEDITDEKDKADNEVFHLSNENVYLRDKIEILESVIAQSSAGNEFENMDWREIIEDDKPPQLKSNNNTMNEIIQ